MLKNKMISKKDVLKKIEQSNFKERSFPKRVCNLMIAEEFDQPLTSKQFTQIYNDGPEKNIKAASLTALMQPLIKKEIVKIKTNKKGKQKIKFWMPGWIDKKDVLLDSSSQILNSLHSEIKKSSARLFGNWHYSEAIFNAFKKIEVLVKNKSNIHNLTGYPLMQKVFSANSPILRFNKFESKTDKDEQRGMMELFSGAIMGIRNPKAHEDIIQTDKIKTLEYLSFASLLCRRLEETIKD